MTTAVLLTGASSGIGRASAERLLRHRELTIWATARRIDDLAPLVAAGARPLQLDVTDEDSMVAAVTTVEAEHGAIGALVNNAGYGQYGTVEETALADVRREFETNVFGLARMTQLVLPGMRAAGSGRIVNMSSMGGRIVFPVGGYYHASKYAVEALSDALRVEVAPFGVRVSVVEPGLIRTRFGGIAGETLSGAEVADGPYAALTAAAAEQMRSSYESRLAAPAVAVAQAVEHAVRARRPRTRYVVTPAAKALVHTRRLLGSRTFDAIVRRQFAWSA